MFTTGIRQETFKNLQLNAGAFLVDFDYSSAKSEAELAELLKTALADPTKTLGATRGGGTFTCAPNERQIEGDGMRYPIKGSTVFDSWDVHMTGTLMEVNAENMGRLAACADVTKDEGGKMTTLKIRTQPEDDDYISSLVWVGDTSKGHCLIDMENALNTNGINLTVTDKGEGTLPFDMRAHKEDVSDIDHAPVTIIFFE